MPRVASRLLRPFDQQMHGRKLSLRSDQVDHLQVRRRGAPLRRCLERPDRLCSAFGDLRCLGHRRSGSRTESMRRFRNRTVRAQRRVSARQPRRVLGAAQRHVDVLESHRGCAFIRAMLDRRCEDILCSPDHAGLMQGRDSGFAITFTPTDRRQRARNRSRFAARGPCRPNDPRTVKARRARRGDGLVTIGVLDHQVC